jgi:hypothetical protein
MLMHAWAVILGLSAIAQSTEGKIDQVQLDLVERNWVTGYQGDALFLNGRMVYSGPRPNGSKFLRIPWKTCNSIVPYPSSSSGRFPKTVSQRPYGPTRPI